MKLSIAMMLGSTTCKMNPRDWNSCGLGCAGNAIGMAQADPAWYEMPDGRPRWMHLYDVWPWIAELQDAKGIVIWRIFDDQVCTGAMTFEQLVDYVASIEPDCGECNRFQCTCVGLRIEEAPADVQKPLVLADRWANENVE